MSRRLSLWPRYNPTVSGQHPLLLYSELDSAATAKTSRPEWRQPPVRGSRQATAGGLVHARIGRESKIAMSADDPSRIVITSPHWVPEPADLPLADPSTSAAVKMNSRALRTRKIHQAVRDRRPSHTTIRPTGICAFVLMVLSPISTSAPTCANPVAINTQ
jgi:hypothetical protein